MSITFRGGRFRVEAHSGSRFDLYHPDMVEKLDRDELGALRDACDRALNASQIEIDATDAA